MPTILTHPVVALALAPFVLHARSGRALLAAGIACTILPDADTLGRHLHVPALELAHRGPTHSVAFAVVAAGAVAAAGRQAWRDVSARRAFAFLFACVLSHGLLDMATNGGPGIALGWPFPTRACSGRGGPSPCRRSMPAASSASAGRAYLPVKRCGCGCPGWRSPPRAWHGASAARSRDEAP